MTIFQIVLAIVGIGFAIAGLKPAIRLIKALAEIWREDVHLRALRARNPTLYAAYLPATPDAIGTGSERSTYAYVDPDGFGKSDHYYFCLAAHYSTRRDNYYRMVGGSFDTVKLFDASIGPILHQDVRNLEVFLKELGCSSSENLRVWLEGELQSWTLWDMAQVLVQSEPYRVDLDQVETYDSDWVSSLRERAERYRNATKRPLDFRSRNLSFVIHTARVGATMGLINDAEALGFIRRAGSELEVRVCRYADWADFAGMICDCECCFDTGPDARDDWAKVAKRLANLPYSPWSKMPLHRSPMQKDFAKVYMPSELSAEFTFAAEPLIPELVEHRLFDSAEKLAPKHALEFAALVSSATDLVKISQDEIDSLLALNVDHPGVLLLASLRAHSLGYLARGTATADLVTPEGFYLLEIRCAEATALALKGLKIAPNHPGLIMAVIQAAYHIGTTDCHLAFEEACEAANGPCLDEMIVQMCLMRWHLEKWGGSAEGSFGLARDRLARGSHPLRGLLFLFAAVEFIALGTECGGEDGREKDPKLRAEVFDVAKELMRSATPETRNRIQSWLLYWAYKADHLEVAQIAGPFSTPFRADVMPWNFTDEGTARLALVCLSDMALPGHPEWRRLNAFHNETKAPQRIN